jgi:hypothetical protein
MRGEGVSKCGYVVKIPIRGPDEAIFTYQRGGETRETSFIHLVLLQYFQVDRIDYKIA